jgi:hypothetical protein
VVVKFSNASSALNVFGSLQARGNRDNKIYITSIKDDTVGGDTNGNGSATSPAKGDWQSIHLFPGSRGDLAWLDVRYGGVLDAISEVLIDNPAAPISVANSVFRDSRFGGMIVQYATVPISLTNNLFARNDAFGLYLWSNPVTLHSSDLVGNTGDGLRMYGANGTNLYNTLVISNTGIGIKVEDSFWPSMANNDVWGNGSNYFGVPDPMGQGGNISSDPLFVNFSAGEYHIRPGSPAVDSGTAIGAPTNDIDGDSRPLGAGYDMGFDERTTGPTAVRLASFGSSSGSGAWPAASVVLAGGLTAFGGLALWRRRKRG